MKKLDKLIVKSFIGPFILTFVVTVFILLLVYMLKYFDDFIGKNLGFGVFGELMGYFSINQMPMALPLAVLISSLMTYGKLGEHFELTAIKGAGISLLRIILPTFIVTVILAFCAFLFSDHVVPVANLRAFSLLYDIKQTKPSMDLREGLFYSGIPNYSIKVAKKYKDEISMSEVVIYDHSANNGNVKVIIADSCRMYPFMGDRYLKMDLYNGNYYLDEEKKRKKGGKNKDPINDFVRSKFNSMELVFSLASFDLKSTDKNLFANNKYMKGIKVLTNSIDSMQASIVDTKYHLYSSISGTYKYNFSSFLMAPNELVTKKSIYDTLVSRKKKRREEKAKGRATPEMTEMPPGEVLKLELPQSTNSTAKINKTKKVKQLPLEKLHLHTGKKKINPSQKPFPKVPQLERPKNREDAMKVAQSFFDNKNTHEELEKKQLQKMHLDSLLISNDSIILVIDNALDSVFQINGNKEQVFSKAVGNARSIKSHLQNAVLRIKGVQQSLYAHVVEKYKKYAQAFSCIVMFLIGAPLGSIIKKGGLGVPVIISIFFFIMFYILTSVSDKWAKSGAVDGMYAAWIANLFLLPIGLFFLKQARKDVKLFDVDFYNVLIDKVKIWWTKRQTVKR